MGSFNRHTIFVILLLFSVHIATGQENNIEISDSDSTKAKKYLLECLNYRYSNPEKSIDYAEKALLIAESKGYYMQSKDALNNLGFLHLMKGEHQLALKEFKRALNITVPAGATLGDTRMRLMVKGPAGGDITDPCGSDATEVEDFSLRIVNGITTGIKESVTYTTIELFPNPANDVTSLRLAAVKNKQVVVQLLDVTGQLVQSSIESLKTGNNTIQLNISELSNGMYLILIDGVALKNASRLVVSH